MADSYLNKSGLSYFWDKIDNKKQNKLTPGSNITISGDTISASQPTVNNGKLTIQKNGSNVGTFTANQSANVTANITVDYVKTADNLTPTADTPVAWKKALNSKNGAFLTWYSTANKFTNQPSAYGFLETFLQSSDIYQRWHTQSSGPILYRSGNASGWSNPSTGAWNTAATTANIGNGTLTIQKNGTNVQTFTANATSDKTANITVPTKTSDLANDSNFVASGDLATVATSGSYNDLSNKPAIPTVNNATLTIQKNGTNVQTFTANQSTNATANITVPTKISDLTNTSGGFVTYCTCTTAAGTAAKVVTIDSGDTNWVLRKGSIIAVKFTNTNTASNVTLNVNNTGAKSVYYNTSVNTGNSNSIFGYANRVVSYLYDGTNWVWISDSRHDGNDNTYTTAYCSTAAGTAAKTASMTGYVLTANRYTVLTITNANTAASALTLNINGKGAKPLYINGTASSSTNHTLPAGSYIVWYDGTNYYIYNNGEIPRMIHSEEPVSVTPPSASVSGSEITDGSITYAKTATGEFLKLQLSTVDIGEGVSLPPNTLYGVYE